ncbi:MAG TPA: hypothetical protein PLK09_08445 [Verrucomicrobiota bacterium]|nr:hypothetical protein [Verrucomicrobiota bacterium]HPW81099.1 hypothetical protein [Verrucomicrobiota bacterium]HQA41307.1 hypothetical protein [Verrucomicrobiota bacterium]HQF59551.1 hypothetical protein [Verrucomicrobiota bacterium]HQK00835.1 hypothetical protein [Verrucomicrobiota bacterium]
MNAATAAYLGRIAFGPPQTHRNIVVFPLLGPDAGPAPYLTLSEALAGHCVIVTEASEGGSVPELKVISQSDRPILLLDGEELVGAKQNRVLNTTILLKERAETTIPVSCVEQGRWSYASAHFADSGAVMSRKSRASKVRSVSESLAAGAHYSSDQGEVWREVAALACSAGVNSPTHAMQDVFKARAAELEACARVLAPTAGQTGLFVVIDGEVAGFDFIAHADAYAKLHPKLLKSYVIGALIEPKPGAVEVAKAAAAAQAFLHEAGESDEKAFESVGYGRDYRYQKPGLAGSALVHEDRVVHMAFFRLPKGESAGSSMASLRQRRRRFSE